MQILSSLYYPITKQQTPQKMLYTKLSPLKSDTVSFSGYSEFVKEKGDFIEQLKAANFCEKDSQYIFLYGLYIQDEKELEFSKKLYNDKTFPKELLYDVIEVFSESDEMYEVAHKNYRTFEKMYYQCLNNPDKYTNGYSSKPKDIIRQIFQIDTRGFFKLAGLEDYQLNDTLLHKRFNNCRTYLTVIDNFFRTEKYELLKNALKCKNIDGKELKPSQKVQILDLMEAYRVTHSDWKPFKQMVDEGIIDFDKLKLDLLTDMLLACGYSKQDIKEIPKRKLNAWDTSNIHLLAKQINKNKYDFIELVKYANDTKSFKTQIHDKTNEYGKVNSITAKQFKYEHLDYKKWVTPPKEININLKTTNTIIPESTKTLGFYNIFVLNVNLLLDSPVETFIKKKYPQYVQDDKFILPDEIRTNKAKLSDFMQKFQKELEPVWQRAEKNQNSSNSEQKNTARHTLTLKSHIDGMIREIKEFENYQPEQNIDLTIKMWDRIPQHDIFQGNYSTCCIAIGDFNGRAMATYLFNTAFNMIELVDNNTDKTIGNALCYYVKDGYGKPALVIDNIEINNNFNPSFETSKKIRDGILEYATNLNKQVAPDRQIPILLGENYNDVPDSDLEILQDELVTLIGKVNDTETYLDAFGGWRYMDYFRDNATFKKLS